MNAVSPELEKPQMPPQAQLMQMAMGFIVSQAISVASKLYIADHLKDGAKSVEQLAELTETDQPALYRLMRALGSVGVFTEDESGKFSLTPMSEFLRSDHPESLRAMGHMICDREHWHAHGNLLHSVKTGGIAFEGAFGKPFFPYIQDKPEIARVFDDAMTSFSRTVGNAVAAVYDFSGAKTIADIGGGHGRLLSTILKTNENAKGILFDQPQVVAGANEVLSETGVSERVEVVGGNFFAEVPVEADIYLMKHIVHDWNDEESIWILQNIAKSAKSGAKVLLVESVVEAEKGVPSMSKVMDLNMLAMTSGRERTAREYAELFEKSGFKFVAVHPTPSPLQIVEAVKV
jgi:ubiquinone/menaquinone biosynthesis C-methylase UbiE